MDYKAPGVEFGIELGLEGRTSRFRLSVVLADRRGRLWGLVPSYLAPAGRCHIVSAEGGKLIGKFDPGVQPKRKASGADDYDGLLPARRLLSFFLIRPDLLADGDLGLFWPTEVVAESECLSMKTISWQDECVQEGAPDDARQTGHVSAVGTILKLDLPEPRGETIVGDLLEVTIAKEADHPSIAANPMLAAGGALIGPVIVSAGKRRFVVPLSPLMSEYGLSLWSPPAGTMEKLDEAAGIARKGVPANEDNMSAWLPPAGEGEEWGDTARTTLTETQRIALSEATRIALDGILFHEKTKPANVIVEGMDT